MNLKLKKTLREKALAARDALPEEERSALSRKIMENLFSLPQWPPSKGAMFFMTMRSEVDTVPMVKAAMERGVRIALPRIAGPGKLEPCWVSDLDAELAPGPMGIREPAESCAKAGVSDIGIVIIPGAAFDGGGARIGYGGGYYDRFLAEVPRALRVAIAFDAQVVDSIDSSPQDVPVDLLVTESGTKVFYRRLTPADWREAGGNEESAGKEARIAAAKPDLPAPTESGGVPEGAENGSKSIAGEQDGATDDAGDETSEDSAQAEPAPSQNGHKPSEKTMKRKKKRGKRR